MAHQSSCIGRSVRKDAFQIDMAIDDHAVVETPCQTTDVLATPGEDARIDQFQVADPRIRVGDISEQTDLVAVSAGVCEVADGVAVPVESSGERYQRAFDDRRETTRACANGLLDNLATDDVELVPGVGRQVEVGHEQASGDARPTRGRAIWTASLGRGCRGVGSRA